ncbi:MAG: SRPBCC family protein [Candidatus Hodarchaeota archaeon]
MGRIEKSIIIKAPPTDVWELLALDRLPEWTEGLQERVEYTSEVSTPENKYRVGASTRTNIKGAGTVDFEITASLKHEKLTYRMLGKRAMNTFVTYLLEPREDGTQFKYVMTYKLPWGILGKAFGKLGEGTLEKEAERSLENLKNILEK